MNTSENNGKMLDERQTKAAAVLVSSGLPLEEAVKLCDASEDELAQWTQNDEFLGYLLSLAEKHALANEPYVISTLLKMVGEQNPQAIRLFFSLCDKRRAARPADPVMPAKALDALRADIFEDGGNEV